MPPPGLPTAFSFIPSGEIPRPAQLDPVEGKILNNILYLVGLPGSRRMESHDAFVTLAGLPGRGAWNRVISSQNLLEPQSRYGELPGSSPESGMQVIAVGSPGGGTHGQQPNTRFNPVGGCTTSCERYDPCKLTGLPVPQSRCGKLHGPSPESGMQVKAVGSPGGGTHG